MNPAPTLRAFIAQLQQATIVALPEDEQWSEHVQRISVAGRIAEVTEEHYFYWLEVLPPKYMSGSLFAFAEGAEPLRLFWHVKPASYVCRQLTWDETKEFCRLARIAPPW